MDDATPPFQISADKSDVLFDQALLAARNYQPADYLLGYIPLPPWIYTKRMKSYVYGDNVTLAANGSQRLDIAMEADSYFLVEQITVVTSEDYASNKAQLTDVQISDSTASQPWQQLPIPLRDVAGFGGNTKKLSTPNLMRPSATLSINLNNLSNAEITYYVAFIGRKVYGLTDTEASFLLQRRWYQYAFVVPAAIPNGVLGSKYTLQIYADSDFLMKKISSYELIQNLYDASTNAGTNVTVQLRDTTNDRYVFNKPLHGRLICGSMYSRIETSAAATPDKLFTYSEAFPLMKPMFIRRNAILEATFNNTGPYDCAPFRMALEGVRVYTPLGA